MNSLEDPTVHISIEEDEPDNEEHNDPTNHEGQQHDKDQAIAPSQSPGHKRVTRSKTNSLPTPIQRYAAALNQDEKRKEENDWASEELKQSLRQLHILPWQHLMLSQNKTQYEIKLRKQQQKSYRH